MVHVAYVAFVLAGFVLIIAGAILGWRWVRSLWFRAAHLLAIVIVCAESLAGAACPLTVMENRLKLRAGEAGYARDFIGYWADRLIFYNAPQWVFTLGYIAFTIAVVAGLMLAPPDWPRRTRCRRPL